MDLGAPRALQVPITELVRYTPPQNVSAASMANGNTYKNLYEATSMNSGLTVVVLINIIVCLAALTFYRYVILREAGLHTREEIELLAKYATADPSDTYTPSGAFVPAPPPMRWKGWKDFFSATDQMLSRDAQVYLLFQRSCILTTALCGAFASVVLLPCYWFGGNLYVVGGGTADKNPPLSLVNMLRSDRGVFEQFTSHNLPKDSPLVLLQFPVMVVVAFCVVFLYTVVKTAGGNSRTISESLTSTTRSRTTRHPASASTDTASPGSSPLAARRRKEWTVFARGLPKDIRSATELSQMLSTIYPSQVAHVELVCKGRMSEVKQTREFLSTKHRYEYLVGLQDGEVNQRFASETMFGQIFGLFVKREKRQDVIEKLAEKMRALEDDIGSRKAEPVRAFRGCAFITFSNGNAAASVIHNFPIRHGMTWMRNCFNSGLIEGSSSNFDPSRSATLLQPPPRVATREKLCFGFPSLGNLYRAIVNILPNGARDWVMATPLLAPRPAVEFFPGYSFFSSTPRNVQYSPQLAASRLRHMKATQAPKSGDIVWHNIGISVFERTVRELFVQFIVFSILILFTSPIAMLTAVKLFVAEVSLLRDPQLLAHHNVTGNPLVPTIDVKKENAALAIADYIAQRLPKALANNDWLRSAIFTYVPVLMLAIVFAVVPSLLRLTCKLEGYPTHSAQEMSVFRKTAFYYVMNAVVLPSVALNTMSEFLTEIYKQSQGWENISSALPILERLFSGDIAFFVCNYLVQLALTGSAFWLMRLPSSFSMMIRRRMALTPLEAAEAKCTDIFDYPRHYAYGVTVMSMCLLFGFMAPVVWWFSFVYFVIKHGVDLYLIRYVHPRSHIDGRLPRLSITFVLVWTVVSQLSIAVIFYLRSWMKAGIATVLLCALTLAACLSASPRVGNRILVLIAQARGRIVKRLIGDGSNVLGWLVSPALVTDRPASVESSLDNGTETHPLLPDRQATHFDPIARRRGRLFSPTVPSDYDDDYIGKSAHTSSDTRVEGVQFGERDESDNEFDDNLSYYSEENVGVDLEAADPFGDELPHRRLHYRSFENGG